MSGAQDRWSKWFTRLVQLVGLAMIVVQQAAVYLLGRDPQPWLLLVAMAMILGGWGLRQAIRGMSGLLGGVTDRKDDAA